jgi:hypothetical protein
VSQIVDLTANANTTETGNTLHYTWRFSGGVIEGPQGASVKWNLADLPEGEYTATVEIDDGCCILVCETKVTVVKPCCCPTVTVTVPEPKPQEECVFETSPVVSANVTGLPPGVRVVGYRWQLRDGKIASGDNTPSITIDTSGLKVRTEIAATVTVIVEENGQTRECPPITRSFIWCPPVVIIEPPVCSVFDSYEDLRFNDEKARLDNFAIRLNSEPGLQGYYVAYSGRGKSGRVEADLRAERAIRYLEDVRNVTVGRVIKRVENNREECFTVMLWHCPVGGNPEPKPLVDLSDPAVSGDSRVVEALRRVKCPPGRAQDSHSRKVTTKSQGKKKR